MILDLLSALAPLRNPGATRVLAGEEEVSYARTVPAATIDAVLEWAAEVTLDREPRPDEVPSFEVLYEWVSAAPREALDAVSDALVALDAGGDPVGRLNLLAVHERWKAGAGVWQGGPTPDRGAGAKLAASAEAGRSRTCHSRAQASRGCTW